MAKLSASKALENYKLKQISNLASALQDSTKASMARRNAISFEEDDEDKPPKPSDILKEYKARIEMEEIQEQEREIRKTGMSRGEFKDYEDTVETQKDLAKTFASEQRTVGRTIAKEGRTAERKASEELDKSVQAAESSTEKKLKIRDKIAEGSGFLPSIIKGQFPKTESTFGIESDIVIITDPLDAPDRTQTKAYFTLEDIDYMIKNNEFENAGINRDEVISALNIDSSTGKAGFPVRNVQELMFKFLKTDHGKGMATAQKMKFQDPNTIKVVSTVRLGDPEE
jgi:hypothetical protein